MARGKFGTAKMKNDFLKRLMKNSKEGNEAFEEAKRAKRAIKSGGKRLVNARQMASSYKTMLLAKKRCEISSMQEVVALIGVVEDDERKNFTIYPRASGEGPKADLKLKRIVKRCSDLGFKVKVKG